MKRYILSILLLASLLPALAQDNVDAEEEKSVFLTWVEDRISTPDRRISISGIDGVLSSNARIGRITVADREGVWLAIEDAEIVWTRTALLRGRLDIDRLAAARIEMRRRPLPAEGAPAPEAGGFSVPELPVAVNLDELAIERIRFGEAAFGLESELTLSGSLNIDTGTFAAELNGQRLDGPGGTLALSASLDDSTDVLDVNFRLDEPENGVVANLLNLYGRPAVTLVLSGSGPLDDLELGLTLDADAERVLAGSLRVGAADAGSRFSARVEGPIGELVTPALRDLFGQNSRLAVDGVRRGTGELAIEQLSLESGALVLEGALETAADGFPTRIDLDGRIAAADGGTVVLPVPGGDTSLQSASLRLDLGGPEAGSWTGEVRIEGFSAAGFSARTFDLDLAGAANRLADPASRELTVNVDGRAAGLSSDQPRLKAAIGDEASLRIRSGWRAGGPLRIDSAVLATNPLEAELSGEVAEWRYNGRFDLRTTNASVLAEALDRPLRGAANLSGSGMIALLTGAFDLLLDGRLQDFAIGNPSVDRLIGGEAHLTGRVIRDERGTGADNLVIESDGLKARANGMFGTEAADFRLDAEIADLALLSDRMSGGMSATVSAAGSDGRIGVDARLAVADGTLSGRDLDEAELVFSGTLEKESLSGQLTGDGYLGRERIAIAAGLFTEPGSQRLDNLEFRVGPSRILGGVARDGEGLLQGELNIDSPDISGLAALLLREASGRARAAIRLTSAGGRQNAEIDASLSELRAEGAVIGSAEIDARLSDLFGVPGADGTLRASEVSAAGFDIAALTANARQEGERTGFEAGARFDNGTSLAAAGALTRLGEGFRLDLSNLDLVRDRVLARLAAPASMQLAGDALRIDSLELEVEGGRISARGSAAAQLDLAVELARLPLATANAIRPDLALSGTVDGTLRITGSRDRPDVSLDLDGSGISARALADAGIPPLSIDVAGRTEGGRLRLDAGISGSSGIDARVSGMVPLAAGDMALDVALRAFPLALLERFSPGLAGTLSGTARVGGTLQRPQAQFDLRGASVRAGVLSDAGIGAIDVAAAGSFADEAVTLTSLRATGPGGLTASASGRIPLAGAGLDLAIDASAPLSLANRFLSGGASASGTARFQGRVGGSLSEPQISGRIASGDGGYADPTLQIALRNITASASIERNRVTIESVRAAIAAGGSLSARGSIDIDAAAGFPADLAIRLEQARYVDGSLVAATVSGDLAVSGALARDPLVSGSIRVDRAEIMVPEQLGGALSPIDVRHVHPPRAVQRTLALARADDGTPVPSGRPSVARLDVTVTAANRIFLRGRGLDAELGGSVRLTGPVSDIQPVGGFHLIRGRLAILGKRIVFDRGEVTLVGDLDPFIDFVATSDAGDVVVTISVSGRVSDPAIVFSSQPELPQDEVLARLIFGRSIAELSVMQMARLAAAAASLVGGGNQSLVDGFRQATGLDELDVITDSSGNAALRAGRYIRDNIYLGVEAGAGGSTRATINIDITEDLKAKGSTGSDGDSSLGIFFEKDY